MSVGIVWNSYSNPSFTLPTAYASILGLSLTKLSGTSSYLQGSSFPKTISTIIFNESKWNSPSSQDYNKITE